MPGEETTCSFDASTAFGVTNAHFIILGCSLFSIFWGVCNAILVKKVDLTKTEHVEKVV